MVFIVLLEVVFRLFSLSLTTYWDSESPDEDLGVGEDNYCSVLMRVTLLLVSKSEPTHLKKCYGIVWVVSLQSTEVHFDKGKETSLVSPVSLALGSLFILPGISSSVTLWPCDVFSQLWLLNCIIRNDKQVVSV